MFKSLANLISKKPEAPAAVQPVSPYLTTPEHAQAPAPAEPAGEHDQFYQSLAMTEEMREALFPKSPQMISAIFERPAANEAPAPVSQDEMQKQLEQLQLQIQQIQSGAGASHLFPII